jgi:hypothetical protein
MFSGILMRVMVSAVVVCGLIALLLVAGCTDVLTKQKAGGFGNAPTTTDNGGRNGGSGNAAAGAVSYPPDTYFAIDCKGEYKVKGQEGDAPWNQHGSFTLNGNVPIPIIAADYEIPTGHAAYVPLYGKDNPLTIHAEKEGCYGSRDDCRPCHFTYDGQIFGTGLMAYNRSNDPEPWAFFFMATAGSEGIDLHTVSFTQTDAGCPLPLDQNLTLKELIDPTVSCFSRAGGITPFSFSDGTEFEVSPHQDPYNVVFTSLKPMATFHIGKAPS